MTDREKLVELLNKSFEDQYKKRGLLTAVHTAEFLIANGVTVNNWRDAQAGKPTRFVSVLVHVPGDHPMPTVREGYCADDGTWVVGMYRRRPGEVAKWKPMPEPPKEE